MNGERLLLSGLGAVTWDGTGIEAVDRALRGTASPFAIEEPREGFAVEVGRVGRIDDPESASSYKRWGQLDTYSRYGFVAARVALEDAGIGLDSEGREQMGVMLGTSFGCMEENQRFDRYEVVDGIVKGASPLVFKGTVDNAPAGWIAVAWKLGGPNATFVSGEGSALEALWSAEGLLRRKRANVLLVGGVERFSDIHLLLAERDEKRHGERLAEGAAIVVLEREDSLAARGRSVQDAHAELVGVARCCGSLDASLSRAMEQLGVDASEVGLVSLAVPRVEDVPGEVVEMWPEYTEVVADKEVLGEAHGAWGGLALSAAVCRLGKAGSGWQGQPLSVIHVFGEGSEHFFAVLRATNWS
jgi:3-oxoacyl-[acyl-carrier-protein] synthase II